MPRAPLRFVYFLYLLTFLYFVSACNKPPQTKITIGSKFFTEQVILAELLAQHIEARTSIPVERKTNLGGTLLVHKALQTGQLDLYVEYTGTALTAVLHELPPGDSAAVYHRVKQLYSDGFHLELTEPLGLKIPSPWSSAATTRKIYTFAPSPISRPWPANGGSAWATNSSSARTVSAAGAIAIISISLNPPGSWTSASSTERSSIIKWTSSPATPPTA